MQDNPLVTIGIPTYNRANGYLRTALQSAVSQDYPNLEIIICDNCSTDNTEAVVKEFRHPGLRYVRHERNIGWNANFNSCLDLATGKFFLLLHDDDVIDSDFVSTCIRSAQGNMNVGVIRTGLRIINDQGITVREHPNSIVGLSNAEFFFAWFRGMSPNYLCNTLYNTDRLRETGGFRSKTHHYCDDAALFRISTRFGRLDIEDVKAGFRRHAENMGSAAKIVDWCEDSTFLLDLMCELEPDRKEDLLREGRHFFSQRNYVRASRIRSLGDRYRAYFVVYRWFSRTYSPFLFLYQRSRERFERRLRKVYGFVLHPTRLFAKV